MITVQVRRVSDTIKYFNKIIRWSKVEIPRLTQDEAERGAKYMVSLMPEQTGVMKRAVSASPMRNAWAVVGRTPSRKGNRPYQVYYDMGKRGWYKGSKKSGHYHFSEKTYEKLKGEYPKKIQNSLRETIK